jgi:hypothetical protein
MPGRSAVFRYERRTEPLLPRSVFLRRWGAHALVALAILTASLAIGVSAYHFTEGLPWIDALLNASMILGGMGPVNQLRTEAGKVFASVYALYSGVVFLVIAGVILVPPLHRLLHRFHLDEQGD